MTKGVYLDDLDSAREERGDSFTREVILPREIVLDLNKARDREPFEVNGDTITAVDATDDFATADIRLERPNADKISFFRNVRIRMRGEVKFGRIYISNAVQANKNLTLTIGGPEGVEIERSGNLQVSSIANPIMANVFVGPESQNNQVGVTNASTLLRAVPAGAVEYIELENIGINDVNLGIGVAATLTKNRIQPGITEKYVVSGGAAGLSIFGIAAVGGPTLVLVLAVPVK